MPIHSLNDPLRPQTLRLLVHPVSNHRLDKRVHVISVGGNILVDKGITGREFIISSRKRIVRGCGKASTSFGPRLGAPGGMS